MILVRDGVGAPDAAARAEVDLRSGDCPSGTRSRPTPASDSPAADGVLHWHYQQAGLLVEGERPSRRFIWMANKETDPLTSFPTTFIESAGMQIKLRLRDRTWDRATVADGELDRYRPDTSRPAKPSAWWDTRGRTSSSGTVGGSVSRMRRTAYAASAFDEAYGAVL